MLSARFSFFFLQFLSILSLFFPATLPLSCSIPSQDLLLLPSALLLLLLPDPVTAL